MSNAYHQKTISQSIAVFAGFVVLSAIGQSISAGDYMGHTTNSIVARSGGFPSLEPRSSDARSRSYAGGLGKPTYRVANPSDGAAESNSLQLAEPNTDAGLALQANAESSRSKMMAPLLTVASSLAIVLALFSALVWAGRKFGGRASGSKPLPAAALTPLGHVMLDPRTKLLLVKCGRRILVLSQTASGITPITEITHPDEVHELMASCSAEAREAFQRALRDVELESGRGFPDVASPTPTVRQTGRLFATA